jgi:hypothetical protein
MASFPHCRIQSSTSSLASFISWLEEKGHGYRLPVFSSQLITSLTISLLTAQGHGIRSAILLNEAESSALLPAATQNW